MWSVKHNNVKVALEFNTKKKMQENVKIIPQMTWKQ